VKGFWSTLALLVVSGCTPAPTADTGTTPPPSKPDAARPAEGGTGGDVQVLTGGAGAAGTAPVAGGESLQGSGSGVNDAAKDAARRAGAKVSGSTAGSAQAPD